MEFVNPFKRHEKRDFIPQSIMPASKLTRTSMQIGRAVPVYTIEVMKNNDWRAKISNVTRFMTMDKPVMNDFEVSFGAFYVPYVALDDVTGSPLAARMSATVATQVAQQGLHARTFFNPSTDDNDRVRVKRLGLPDYGYINLVGSLYNHLRYPIYYDVDIWHLKSDGTITDESDDTLFTIINGTLDQPTFPYTKVNDWSGLFLFDTIHPVALKYPISGTPTQYYHSIGSAVGGAQVMRAYVPFDVWCICNPEFNFYPANKDYFVNTISNWHSAIYDYNGSIVNLLENNEFHPVWNAENYRAAFLAFDIVWNANVNASNVHLPEQMWSTYFGKYTREQVMDMYINYLTNAVLLTSAVGISADQQYAQTPWLAYIRIYGDYFLNPLVTDKEKFFAYMTAMYVRSNQQGTVADWFNWSFTQLGENDNIRFFTSYLANGECLPVLWEKDFFTSCLIKEQIGDEVTLSDGDSIPELFYKRMYHKFKNLIARLGSDYRTNSDALYGGQIPDNTLDRSQVIAFRRFKVNTASIAQTSASSSNGALADFAGFAYSADSDNDELNWTAQENGLIMILCWVRPMYTAITTAIPKLLKKFEYLDFLLPQWSGVGYQDVPFGLLRPSDAEHQNLKFGIQERYFEYMTMLNESSGSFLTTARQYAVDREVNEVVQLGENLSPAFLYITEADDINRIFTDKTSDPILASIYIEGTITRQIPAEIRTDF